VYSSYLRKKAFLNRDIIAYYNARATEYDKLYDKPERQPDLLVASALLQEIFSGKDVLEIACGTGYWTTQIAKTAKSILATDINLSVIDLARSKTYGRAPVRFELANVFDMSSFRNHESLFGGFIWNHIPLQDLDRFIGSVNDIVRPGGTVVFMDSKYVEGSNHPIAETDAFGNTYQIRTLEDGSLHRVLKNFPAEVFLRKTLEDKSTDVRYTDLDHYWILRYQTLQH
jgi:ubiquinone/menaquinone biosynthesis C-methylase UbiE